MNKLLKTFIIVVLSLFTFNVGNAEKTDYFVIMLEENKNHTILQAQIAFTDINDVKTLLEFHKSDETKANDFFLELLADGKALQIPFMVYEVEFVFLGEGYTIYKLK